eukprot:3092668-Amphidinium_carterae.1
MVKKVAGTKNPADLLTKGVSSDTLQRLRPALGILLFGGVHDAKLVQVKAITSKSRAAEAQQRYLEVQRSEIGKWYKGRNLESVAESLK